MPNPLSIALDTLVAWVKSGLVSVRYDAITDAACVNFEKIPHKKYDHSEEVDHNIPELLLLVDKDEDGTVYCVEFIGCSSVWSASTWATLAHPELF